MENKNMTHTASNDLKRFYCKLKNTCYW